MNFKARRAERILHSSRYKAGERKFSSLEEARTQRAVQKRDERKIQREKSLAHFRALPTVEGGQENVPQDRNTRKKKFTKNELELMGRHRYQEMLKWREQRRRMLEKEKRSRLPNFQTGLYHPDPPKFLSGMDIDSNSGKVTPRKFTPGVSSKKPIASSTRPQGRILDVAKPLHFYSGATPHAPNEALSSKFHKGKVLPLGRRIAPGFPSRVSRPFRPPPGRGVSILPSTPSVDPTKIPVKRMKSFAPDNFSFQAPKGIASFVLGCTENSQGTSEQREDLVERKEFSLAPSFPRTEVREDLVAERTGFESALSPQHPLNVSFTVLDKEDGKGYPAEPVSHFEVEKVMGEETHPQSREGQSAPKTPRRYSRRSRALATPPLARLRPRTPCSRSTRISKFAHCDHSQVVPCESASRRKSRRKTKGSPDGREGSPSKGASSAHETPATKISATPTAADEEAVWAAEGSPWITRSRGSSSKKSGKGGQQRGQDVFSNDLERIFNGFPPINSVDAPDASPQLKGSNAPVRGEDEIAALIHLREHAPSNIPDVFVWGTPDSPAETSPLAQHQPFNPSVHDSNPSVNRPPLAEISPASRASNAPSGNKRNKHPSVSFTPVLSGKTDQPPTTPFRFPVTPIRRSTRASMGLLAKVPVTPEIMKPSCEAMKPSSLVASGDGRVSLLPGLYPHGEEKEASLPRGTPAINENTDLISWDTPDPVPATLLRRWRSKKPDALMPVRRSRRLSRLATASLD